LERAGQINEPTHIHKSADPEEPDISETSSSVETLDTASPVPPQINRKFEDLQELIALAAAHTFTGDLMPTFEQNPSPPNSDAL